MDTVKSISDLKNDYNKISELCREYSEPVFITKNGVRDLAVMSIEAYELLTGKLQLYSLIEEGFNHVKQGKVKPMKEAINSIRANINQ